MGSRDLNYYKSPSSVGVSHRVKAVERQGGGGTGDLGRNMDAHKAFKKTKDR